MVHRIDDNDAYACQVCKISLMRFPGPDGTETMVHTRPWEEYDHEPDPVPAHEIRNRRLVCDFCGELDATWQYFGEALSTLAQRDVGEPLEHLQNIDGIWAGCEGCDKFVRRNDLEGLLNRYEKAIIPKRANKWLAEMRMDHWASDPAGAETGMGHQQQMWAAYLPTIRHRARIVEPKPMPPMRPAQMPKIRDRLVEQWLTKRARDGLRYDAKNGGGIALPGYLFDSDGFMHMIQHDELPDDLLNRHIERVVLGLNAGELYWISPQFTHLAVTAAKNLPDITILPNELPGAHGFIIWQDPIQEIPLPTGLRVAVRGASWSLIPGGVWVTVYVPPESGQSSLEPEMLRRELGWLIPWSAGGGAAFGTHEVGVADENNLLLRSLVSTWLLMRQPGMATTTTEDVYPDIRKKYKRAGRPDPTVHLVNIRRTERAPRAAGEQTTRNYTGAWSVGWRTGGFWRNYWTGPGRSVRDRRWIDPYIARGDLPMKGDPAPKPTVKVLK